MARTDTETWGGLSDPATVARAQGWSNIVGGIWPLIGLRSFEAIEPLETDTGLPVVTSNQAGLWQALRMAGIEDRLPNLGKLLQDH